jgi:glycosyltransferase involved in cell wall biosynthesis
VRHTAAGLARVGDVDCLHWHPVPWSRDATVGTREVPWNGPTPGGRLLRTSRRGIPSRLNRAYGAAWVTAARVRGVGAVLPFEISRSGRPRRGSMHELASLARHYDLLWCFKLDAAVALRPLLDVGRPAVVDLDDLVYLPLDPPRGATSLERLDRESWWAAFHTIERRAQLLTVANPDEAVRLGPHVAVVPNGADVPDELATRAARPRPVLTFVGLMRYEANRDGAAWLVQHIVPELRRRLGDDFEVRIVGEATPAVRALAAEPNVTVTGFVDDLERELARSDLVVVPLRLGTGTRLKILEGFAHGIPVVSTTIGAAGLDVRSGEHLLLADTPTEFASACARLLGDQALRAQVVDAARRLVESTYDWRTIERKIGELALGVLGTEPHATAGSL